MKKIIRYAAAAVAATFFCAFAQTPSANAQSGRAQKLTPDGTYLFAKRDTCDLFMDLYEPMKGSDTQFLSGKEKPTVIFMFGGGFKGGHRDARDLMPLFDALTREGLKVVAIDYRLGLKDQKNVGLGSVDAIDNAIHIAVEDLFSATSFIIENAEELGIDPENIVVMGSSAGAISVLQAEYEICNGTAWARVLPEGFNYSGVVSLAGAVLSREGALKYRNEPCPQALFHGTADKVVNYKQIRFFNIGWFGSSVIASVSRKNGYNYRIYRYDGCKHEIAGAGLENVPAIMEFLEVNVSGGVRRIVDATVTDPRIEPSTLTLSELYN